MKFLSVLVVLLVWDTRPATAASYDFVLQYVKFSGDIDICPAMGNITIQGEARSTLCLKDEVKSATFVVVNGGPITLKSLSTPLNISWQGKNATVTYSFKLDENCVGVLTGCNVMAPATPSTTTTTGTTTKPATSSSTTTTASKETVSSGFEEEVELEEGEEDIDKENLQPLQLDTYQPGIGYSITKRPKKTSKAAAVAVAVIEALILFGILCYFLYTRCYVPRRGGFRSAQPTYPAATYHNGANNIELPPTTPRAAPPPPLSAYSQPGYRDAHLAPPPPAHPTNQYNNRSFDDFDDDF